LKRLVHVIDYISEWSGRILSWLCVAVIIVLVYEVVMRYVFDKPQIWTSQMGCMMGGAIVALGWAYTHRHSRHVRVDVFYGHASPRGKAIIDVVCALVMFFPLMFALIYSAVLWAHTSMVMNERLTYSFWFPPAYPSRIVVVVGLSLFTLQGVARFIRDLHLIIKGKTL